MLLKQAPTILAAADALLAKSKSRPAPAQPSADDSAVRQRLDQLEELQRSDAMVIKQLADQVSALTAAARVDAARTRLALTLGAAGVVIGVVATLLAWAV
jgi:hypothetical protein